MIRNEDKTKDFPDELDGAEVLYYTSKGNYGEMRYDTGEIAAYFRYLAICRYPNQKGYYVFMCNKAMEVETDQLYGTLEECMNGTASYDTVWIKKQHGE